jgi:hypothetical protein
MFLGHIHLFSQSFSRKRSIRSREIKERKDKVGKTFVSPAVVRTLLFLNLWRKRWIWWRENKERKDKVGILFDRLQ